MGMNLYGYCSGNPTSRVDPSGHSWITNTVLTTIILSLVQVAKVANSVMSSPTPSQSAAPSQGYSGSSMAPASSSNQPGPLAIYDGYVMLHSIVSRNGGVSGAVDGGYLVEMYGRVVIFNNNQVKNAFGQVLIKQQVLADAFWNQMLADRYGSKAGFISAMLSHEAGHEFSSMDEAAVAFGLRYQGATVYDRAPEGGTAWAHANRGQEYGALIVQNDNGTFSFTNVVTSSGNNVLTSEGKIDNYGTIFNFTTSATIVATIHSHPPNNVFSAEFIKNPDTGVYDKPGDKTVLAGYANGKGIYTHYLVGCSGNIYRANISDGKMQGQSIVK